MDDAISYPRVRIVVEMPTPDDPVIHDHLEKTTQALALVYALVVSRPHILLGLFNRILKTSAEMFRDEVAAQEGNDGETQ